MLTGLAVENVRLFAGELRRLHLRPITVFCGTNSSGKSTLLKLIPLIKQSQVGDDSEHNRGHLRFRSSQVDLGSYPSLVSENDCSRNMKIGFSFTGEIQETLAAPLLEGDVDLASLADKERTLEYEVECLFQFEAKRSGNSDSRVAVLSYSEFKLQIPGLAPFKWTAMPLDNSEHRLYQLRFPHSYFTRTKMSRALKAQHMEPDRQGNVSLVAVQKDLLPFAIIAPIETGVKGAPTYSRWALPPLIDIPLQRLRETLRGCHYVAPLRTPGKRYYIAESDTFPGMDATGEFLPYILRDYHARLVLNWKVSDHTVTIEEEPLLEALSRWLYFFRTGVWSGNEQSQLELELNSSSQPLVELKLRSVDGNLSYSLADSGFGYSQIIPVIVRGLMINPGETLFVEQPELHLHPALQVRLANFLMAMAATQKQIVVETHSEHLVNALRVAVAEDPTGNLAEATKIYFLNVEGKVPTVFDLSVHKDGTLSDWPRSFFGEALELSGRLLRAQKRFKDKQPT